MAGLIFKKQEMTKMWVDGKNIPVTLVKLIPQEIIRYKTLEKDGYIAVVIGTEKKVLNKEKGIKDKFKYSTEFKINEEFMKNNEVGKNLDFSLIDDNINTIKVVGISKGKGFQGVIRRFHFAGGPETHGSKFHRRPGSIGNRKPRRVNKGHPLPGHMGLNKITLKNIKIVDKFNIDGDQLLALKGSIPGAYNSIVKIEF